MEGYEDKPTCRLISQKYRLSFSGILTKVCEMESELNFLYFKVVSRSIPLTLWKGGEQQMKNVLLRANSQC